MLGRKAVKAHQFILIFFQALTRFFIFDTVEMNESIISFKGILFSLGHVDFVDRFLGFGLEFLGEFIEHIGRLMDSATLLPCAGKNLFNSSPKP